MGRMDLTTLNLSTLSNLAVFVLEQDAEKRTRCMQTFSKNKEGVQIVTNEQSHPLYTSFERVQTTYNSSTYDDYTRGTTFLFDDCFADAEWVKDTNLHRFISYPRMLEVTTVFGFRQFPRIPPRMYWNLDLICIGENSSSDTRKKIYESFFLYMISYETFCDLLDTYTKENGFLVLRREGTEDRLYRAYC
jgi:hypothetical protein